MASTYLVTGASRGLGAELVKQLCARDHRVLAAMRDPKHGDAARRAGATVVQLDVDRPETFDAFAASLDRPVDVLVNNAGIGFHADALTLDDSDWRRLFDTNLDAVWMASQIVGRQMVARRAGSIINNGSISGLIVNRPQWHSAYGISKAAVHHLTKSLAAEWASKGVRVNAIAPGYVKTEIAKTEYDDYRHYWRDEVPLQRYATPDEIAPIALLLASDAGSFITGSIFVVDGGYTLW